MPSSSYSALGKDDSLYALRTHENISTETIAKPYASTEEELIKELEREQNNGYHLRRFYFRALVGVLGPLVVTGYFITVWRIYLAPIDPDNPIAFGPPGAKWIFYSWFAVGVIGLNLSLYGLKGVEASMMMEPAWNVGDGMKLMLHASNTWSGPGGWLKTWKWSWKRGRDGGYVRLPTPLWFVLALPSIFVFAAYPLSGLTMEMTQGYLHGNTRGSRVIGYSFAEFNDRKPEKSLQRASTIWSNALDTRVPGRGIIYTPEGYDRSGASYLNELPSFLPIDSPVHDIFLTGQANHPIEGRSWGLMLSYDCRIIKNLQDLRILNNHTRSQQNLGRTTRGNRTTSGRYIIKQGEQIVLLQNETTVREPWAEDIMGISEIGYQQRRDKLRSSNNTKSNPWNISLRDCYVNRTANLTANYQDVDGKGVFEVILWQHLANITYSPKTTLQYNETLDYNITELYGAYNLEKAGLGETSSAQIQPMTAIGVQCEASSNIGWADINGVRSTYSNFRPSYPYRPDGRCANRLQAESPFKMFDGQNWLAEFFYSTGSPAAIFIKRTKTKDYRGQLKYLQAEQLRQSMLRAYAAYAIQLMYNGGQGITYRSGSGDSFQNNNVTEFVPGTVITMGVMPPAIPVLLFTAWTLIASSLGVVYGFRRRWTAMLDGYTMFRLGTDLPDHLRRTVASQSNTLEVEDCSSLNDVPGLVGDMKADVWIGRIGLINGDCAVKGKMYE